MAWTTSLTATTAVSMPSYKCSSTAPLCRSGCGTWPFLRNMRCIQLTHTLLSVCLPVYRIEPVFAVKQTCSLLQADLLTWMTLRSVSSAALCCMRLSCSVQSSAALTLGALSLSACFAFKLLQQYPAKLASALNCQSAACLCVPTDSLCANLSLCCQSSRQTATK